jgi:glyoxylase-like metal-dependent hydrolase (beta-lactamase superfamily II)
MIVKSFPVGLLQCNCTIVACPKTKQAIVVDPGGEEEKILAELKARDLTVVQIIHTHAHFDHVGATRAVQAATGAEVLLHPGDTYLIETFREQPKMVGLPIDLGEAPTIDRELEHMQTLEFGEQHTLVLHTPGHTPGSVCFSLKTDEGMLLLSGDTLFKMGIGRTDFPGGNSDQLLGSIQDRILGLDDDTRVIPGHGPETTVGFERRSNPFLR